MSTWIIITRDKVEWEFRDLGDKRTAEVTKDTIVEIKMPMVDTPVLFHRQ